MCDESKTTLCMSNYQNFRGGFKRDLQKQVLHTWAKMLQKSQGTVYGEFTFTYYKWELYKFCIAAALQNQSISLSLHLITITIMEQQLFKQPSHSPRTHIPEQTPVCSLPPHISNPGAWAEYRCVQASCSSFGGCWRMTTWNVNFHLSEVQVKLTPKGEAGGPFPSDQSAKATVVPQEAPSHVLGDRDGVKAKWSQVQHRAETHPGQVVGPY